MLLLTGKSLLGQQKNEFQKDFDFLYQELQKTPSYADQITGEKKTAYQNLYAKLKAQPVAPTALDTFYNLSKLLWPIKDKHLAFYQNYNRDIDFKTLQTPGFIRDYRTSPTFKSFPRVKLNLDSLESSLAKKATGSVEGIYVIGDVAKIGIYRTLRKDSLVGVLLSSKLQTWDRGQLFSILIQTSPNSFRTVYCDLATKAFRYVENDKLTNGQFHHYDLKKLNIVSYANFRSNDAYIFNTLEPNIQYLHLGSFNGSPENLKIAKAFYNRIKDTLTAPNLIVDLRGNIGGAAKCANQFFALLKNYSEKGKVFVLINGMVISMGERFALRLKPIKNIKLFGETTNGMIAYGNNDGYSPVLPSGRFKLYPTNMPDEAGLLQYEEVGVEPHVFLNNKSDWIKQLKVIIRRTTVN
ncbi:hypothetical protein [Mucilaginibacter antarcticus]|uniref:hypothetical protein n=1 Tax=Mucilaginibacter antarcticus TaxID=1855725 RepID=UPI00366CD7B8